MNYYRRFLGDYHRDTQTLTALEHGIYVLLLDTLYATERPIPSIEEAYRAARCTNPVGRTLCKRIVSRYFIAREDGIWHKRVDEEINLANSRRNKASAAAKVRHAPAPSSAPGMLQAVLQPCPPDFILHTPDIKKEKVKTSSPANGAGGTMGSPEFRTFWNVYPKRVDRQEALRAWVKGLCDGSLGEILAGLEKWKQTEQWTDSDKIPYPSTWLNKRRWKEAPEPGINKAEQKGRNTDAAIERVKQRLDSGMGEPVKQAFRN